MTPPWRPIATAPRDGILVLLLLDAPMPSVPGYWDVDVWRDAPGRDAITPTHWMPLPDAPATAEATS